MFILNNKFRDSFFTNNHSNTTSHKLESDYKIEHKENSSEISISAPGYKKADFTVEIEDEYLTIRTQDKTSKYLKNTKSLQKEFHIKTVNKQFKISGKKYDLENVNVVYKAGILHVEFPKNASTKKRIVIN